MRLLKPTQHLPNTLCHRKAWESDGDSNSSFLGEHFVILNKSNNVTVFQVSHLSNGANNTELSKLLLIINETRVIIVPDT